jgi:hypothetical protein
MIYSAHLILGFTVLSAKLGGTSDAPPAKKELNLIIAANQLSPICNFLLPTKEKPPRPD